MRPRITAIPLALSLTIIVAIPTSRCAAAETVVAVHARVTAVSDDAGWFNGSITVGMPVEGT